VADAAWRCVDRNKREAEAEGVLRQSVRTEEKEKEEEMR
jgi:hypothetical protein